MKEKIELDENQKKLFKEVFNKVICKNTNDNKVFNDLIDSIELIPFNIFIASIIKSFNTFINKLRKDNETFKDYILLINIGKDDDGTNKSNLWISLLILSLLYLYDDICFNIFLTDNKYSLIQIIQHLPKNIYFFQTFYELANILKTNLELENQIDLLFCDDISFSGNQLSDYLNKLYINLSSLQLRIHLNFILGYMGDQAINRIKETFERRFSQHDFPSFVSSGQLKYFSETRKDYNDEEIKQIKEKIQSFSFDKSLTIFDYKLADETSVYYGLILGFLDDQKNIILDEDKYTNKTLIKLCNDISKDKLDEQCGLAFYKKKMKYMII